MDFSALLREAIARSGLSLAEISRGLHERGTPVSISALSYWQTGSNVPERAASIAAIRHLEAMLGLAAGSAIATLPARKPRGRYQPRANHRSLLDRTWRSAPALTRMLAKLDAQPEDLAQPAKVAQHATYYLDAFGEEHSVRMRRILLAQHDGVTRTFFAMRCSSLPQAPVVTYAQGCTLSRFRGDGASSTCVFEFQLQQTLNRGDLGLVEFWIRYPPGQNETRATLRANAGARDLTMSVVFHPSRVPLRCYSSYQATISGEHRTIGDGPVLIQLDPPPGIYALRWEWS